MSGKAAKRLRGAAAIEEMLELIGAVGSDDHKVAKVLVDHEMEIRALMNFALSRLSQEMPA